MIRLICFSLMTLFISCSTPKKDPSLLTLNDVEMSLEKGVCFGSCPVYTFNIYPGGYCEYLGKMNTRKIGKHALQLSNEKYREVKKAFKEENLFQFKDYYESKIVDLATVTITFRNGDKVKTITGKRERPTEVLRLQLLLEGIAESDTGWTVIDGTLLKSDIAQYDKSKIVVKLKSGAQLTRWFNNVRKSYGVQVLKQMSSKDDIWLISYDPKPYSPEEMLGILTNDPSVLEADFLLIDEE